MQQTIARPSVASLPVEARSQGTPLSSATGFVVERGGRSYLLTNWHVVTGRRPDDNSVLSPAGGLPDELMILHNREGALGSLVDKVEALYQENGAPRWIEHPQFGPRADVVALELTERGDIAIYPHDPWAEGPGFVLGVASAVSIVGFPFGITGGGGLGIWVRGTIATEPTIDFNNAPCFLIDSRTRPGQSGSPVIAYQAGGVATMDDGSTRVFTGVLEQFLGVYSGRINAQSDLGFVWKSTVRRSRGD
jgi:hypothetical protein